jgi:hypothetical protein
MAEKIYFLKDQNEVAKVTFEMLQGMVKDPTRMPKCIICTVERSYMIVIYTVEGESKTMIVGLCEKCWPRENGVELTPGIQRKISETLNNKLVDGNGVLHLKTTEWIQ